MKVSANLCGHRYGLKPKSGSNPPRRGCLLRFEFDDGVFGYSDCHPWPELGDADLDVQLALLRAGRWTDLLRRSYEFARVDAQARARGESVWVGGVLRGDAGGVNGGHGALIVPPSHFLVTEFAGCSEGGLLSLAQRGFRKVKIKVGRDPVGEISRLRSLSGVLRETGLQLRLDFNEKLSLGAVSEFLAELAPVRDWIEFIEDPCAYDPVAWRGLYERFRIPLSLDRAGSVVALGAMPAGADPGLGAFQYLVLKPAVQDPEALCVLALRMDARLMVTSYLDHPLGQLGAAWVAATLVRRGVQLTECGLLTHFVYDFESPKGSRAEWDAPFEVLETRLIPPAGTGLGFDQTLAALEWEVLSVG